MPPGAHSAHAHARTHSLGHLCVHELRAGVAGRSLSDAVASLRKIAEELTDGRVHSRRL